MFNFMILCIFLSCLTFWVLMVVLVVKNPPANTGDIRDVGLIPRSRRSLEEGMKTVLESILPGERHGQRSLADYSP